MQQPGPWPMPKANLQPVPKANPQPMPKTNPQPVLRANPKPIPPPPTKRHPHRNVSKNPMGWQPQHPPQHAAASNNTAANAAAATATAAAVVAAGIAPVAAIVAQLVFAVVADGELAANGIAAITAVAGVPIVDGNIGRTIVVGLEDPIDDHEEVGEPTGFQSRLDDLAAVAFAQRPFGSNVRMDDVVVLRCRIRLVGQDAVMHPLA